MLSLRRLAIKIGTRSGVAKLWLVKRVGLLVISHFQSRPVQVLCRDGCKLWVDPSSPVGEALLTEGIWEAHLTNALKGLATPGMVAIDAGANVGYYSVLLSKLAGDSGRVFAFEPEYRNLTLLRRNLALNGVSNVTVVDSAVSDTDGQTELWLNPIDSGSHSLVQSFEPRRSRRVKSVTLDSFVRENNVAKVDLVKLDIEGAEIRALEGMRQILDENPGISVLMELNGAAQLASGARPDEVAHTIAALELAAQLVETGQPAEVERLIASGSIVDLVCRRVARPDRSS